ncbi:MAG: response regulator [Actinomycetota bacterium]
MLHAKKGTILVIDDNSNNLEIIYNLLEEYHYEVLVEMDGESGILQVKNNPPDLILLDVMMPGIDGFETCRILQGYPGLREIPIIFMTALSDPVDKVKGLKLGAVDYITKPFHSEEVIARIGVHLKLRRLNLELIDQKQQLEQRVQERTLELWQALEHLKQIQLQLISTEKMSSIGQLVAGIAHEINNPVGCISGNLGLANQAVQDLINYLQLYQKKFPDPGEELKEKAEEIELEYLVQDLPEMLSSMKMGIGRIGELSTSLRTFSRADSVTKELANIHEGLDSTLMILHHRLKVNDTRPAIQVIKKYGEIPPIECYLGKLNQVFMNLIANAIDSLEEANQGRSFQEIKANPNQIIITTALSPHAQNVIIKIRDNGKGIPEELQPKIFDYLFTTKPVGKGTGLGLSISRQIVEETHGGCLTCESVMGEWTEFVIVLPHQLYS